MEDNAAGPESAGLEAILPDPPTLQQAEKAEQLIRQAQIAKRRGETALAGKLLDEALLVSPGSSSVNEAIGDDLLDRKQVKAAKEAFALAYKIDARNVSAERKYCECVLRLAAIVDPFALAGSGGSSSAATGKSAFLLSLFIPGLGQMITDQVAKGSVMLGGWVVGWIWALLIPDGVRGLLAQIGIRTGKNGAELNGWVLVPLAISAAFHLWSLYDAAAQAGTHKRVKIDHPVPPVDKSFEL